VNAVTGQNGAIQTKKIRQHKNRETRSVCQQIEWEFLAKVTEGAVNVSLRTDETKAGTVS
jgi:hypothetical protein